MSWVALKTWAVGDVLTAADMNTYVRDNPYEKPFCQVGRSGDQVTGSGETTMDWDSVSYDTDGMEDTANGRIVIVTAGTYRVRSSLLFADTSGGFYSGVRNYVNGSGVSPFTSLPNQNTGFQANVRVAESYHALAVGDTVQSRSHQNTAGSLSVLAGTQTYLVVELVKI